MARIAGVNLPVQKHVWVGLQSIYGIGRTRSKLVCESAGVTPATKIRDLTEAQVEKLRAEIGKFVVEGDLRREVGMSIKRAVMHGRRITHPDDAELGFLYGTIFIGPPESPEAHSRNVCIFADGEVDRSPTGTGVSGRLAIHHARGEIGLDQRIVIESILGTTFSGRVLEETRVGEYKAVIPEVTGSAYITGRHEFVIDPADPLAKGFMLR
jgi:ribosomal protein uS13